MARDLFNVTLQGTEPTDSKRVAIGGESANAFNIVWSNLKKWIANTTSGVIPYFNGSKFVDSPLSTDGTDVLKDGTSIINTAELQNSLVGGYYRFKTDDYVTIPNNANLNFGADTDFTLVTRFKTNNITTTQSLIHKGSQGGGGKRYSLFISGSGITFELDDDSSPSTINAPSVIEADKWCTLVVTADRNGNGVIYLNGVNIGSGDISSTGDIDDVSKPLAIGILSSDLTTSPFDGDRAFVLIYNKVLTNALEISQWDSNNPPIPFEDVGASQTDLLSGWDFTTWSIVGTAVIDDLDSFTTTASDGIRDSGLGIIADKTYLITIAGTTSATELRVLNSGQSVNIKTGLTGTFSESFIYSNAIAGGLYLQNIGAGTTDITTFEIIQIGNILNLNESGITDATWYDNSGNDLDGTVSGATAIRAKTTGFDNIVVNSSTTLLGDVLIDRTDEAAHPRVTFAQDLIGDDNWIQVNRTTDEMEFRQAGIDVLKLDSSANSAFGGNVSPDANNAYTIGDGTNRWSEIFAVNGTINTSDERLKTDINPSDLGLDFVSKLDAILYKLKEGKNQVSFETIYEDVEQQVVKDEEIKINDTEIVDIDGKYIERDIVRIEIKSVPQFNEVELYNEDGEVIGVHKIPIMEVVKVPIKRVKTFKSIAGKRNHYGFTAQQVKLVLDELGVKDFAGYIQTDMDNPESDLGLRYTEFIAPIVKAIQELKEILDKNNIN